MNQIDPKQFIITRKRKKYKFAVFHNSPLCFEMEEWKRSSTTDTLEMGAGTGLFSVALAKEAPGEHIVACDIKADRLQKGAQLAEIEGLSNVQFLRARGDLLLDLFALGSLKTIWVTFPDPFPKERSAKHRLIHRRFLQMYHALLRPDGVLYFKTDATALFDWGLEQLVESGWSIAELSFDLHASNLSEIYKIPTTYEARYKTLGKRICFVKALPPKRANDDAPIGR